MHAPFLYEDHGQVDEIDGVLREDEPVDGGRKVARSAARRQDYYRHRRHRSIRELFLLLLQKPHSFYRRLTLVVDPMLMEDPIPMVNTMPMVDPIPMVEPMPIVDPTPMVDLIPMVDPTPRVDPIPMVDLIPICHPHYALCHCLRRRLIELFPLVLFLGCPLM